MGWIGIPCPAGSTSKSASSRSSCCRVAIAWSFSSACCGSRGLASVSCACAPARRPGSVSRRVPRSWCASSAVPVLRRACLPTPAVRASRLRRSVRCPGGARQWSPRPACAFVSPRLCVVRFRFCVFCMRSFRLRPGPLGGASRTGAAVRRAALGTDPARAEPAWCAAGARHGLGDRPGVRSPSLVASSSLLPCRPRPPRVRAPCAAGPARARDLSRAPYVRRPGCSRIPAFACG